MLGSQRFCARTSACASNSVALVAERKLSKVAQEPTESDARTDTKCSAEIATPLTTAVATKRSERPPPPLPWRLRRSPAAQHASAGGFTLARAEARDEIIFAKRRARTRMRDGVGTSGGGQL